MLNIAVERNEAYLRVSGCIGCQGPKVDLPAFLVVTKEEFASCVRGGENDDEGAE